MTISYIKTQIKIIFDILLLLTILGSSVMKPTNIYAKKLIFSDNFNDNDFSDWIIVRNMQWNDHSKVCMNYDQLATWNIKDGALGIDINGPGCVTEIIPSSFTLTGISNFSYEFDWNFKSPPTGDHNVIFLWKDEFNWYDIKVTNGGIWLQKIVNGKAYWLNPSTSSYNFRNNTFHHISIVKNNNNIKLIIDGTEILNTQDKEPYITGGNITLGLQASVGAIRESHSYFDNIKVYDLDAEEDYFKQTDPQWAEKEYDHASKWSQNSTIGRWGCALTSMATLLRHYNITKLPPADDSQERLEVTPETLNTWLKSQPDGYLGNGLLNWIAVTRLTRLINHYDQTPKLEYQYLPIKNQDHPYQEAIDELEADRWTLANIPGHFVTVHDTNADKTDLAIYDPYFDISWMSQHTSQNKPPKSYRKFVPSQTDLSYLLFAFPSDISVKILNDKNQDITDQYTYIEQINDPNDETSSTSIKLVSIPKPETSKFYLSVEAETAKLADITIFAYDDQANLTNLSQTDLPLGIRPIEFEIDYQKQASSQIKPVALDKKTLISTANDLAQNHQLPWKVNFWLTTYLSAWQTNQNTSLWPKYQTKVIDLIEWFKPDLDQVVYLYFKQAVKNLTSN